MSIDELLRRARSRAYALRQENQRFDAKLVEDLCEALDRSTRPESAFEAWKRRIRDAAAKLSATPAEIEGLWNIPGGPELTEMQLIQLADQAPLAARAGEQT